MFTKHKPSIGYAIESRVAKWLQQQGMHVLLRNYRAAVGEIDIIMLDGDYLVFVEVRYRRQARFGSAVESIDWRKQQNIVRTAQHFLRAHKRYHTKSCRFDVVAAQPVGHDDQLQFEWIKHAFQ